MDGRARRHRQCRWRHGSSSEKEQRRRDGERRGASSIGGVTVARLRCRWCHGVWEGVGGAMGYGRASNEAQTTPMASRQLDGATIIWTLCTVALGMPVTVCIKVSWFSASRINVRRHIFSWASASPLHVHWISGSWISVVDSVSARSVSAGSLSAGSAWQCQPNLGQLGPCQTDQIYTDQGQPGHSASESAGFEFELVGPVSVGSVSPGSVSTGSVSTGSVSTEVDQCQPDQSQPGHCQPGRYQPDQGQPSQCQPGQYQQGLSRPD